MPVILQKTHTQKNTTNMGEPAMHPSHTASGTKALISETDTLAGQPVLAKQVPTSLREGPSGSSQAAEQLRQSLQSLAKTTSETLGISPSGYPREIFKGKIQVSYWL